MAKKSIFEKMGLVEKVEAENSYDTDSYEEQEIEEELPEVNTKNVGYENIVSDIYSENNLMDNIDTSIFKVEEIKATLPTTMTTEAMQNTVFGILGSFKLTPEGLIEDANKRIEILQAARIGLVNENTDVINNCKCEIEELKQAIMDLEKNIAERESHIENVTKSVDNEVKRIDDLCNFLKK